MRSSGSTEVLMHRNLACLGITLLGVAAFACSAPNGKIIGAQPPGGEGGNPIAGSGGVSGGGSTASPGAAPTTASCPSTEMTRTPLRRLTRIEYANSVKSILGVDPAPADALPADEVTDGFSNNAEVLTVSPLHAEKYVLVSEALAKAAVT